MLSILFEFFNRKNAPVILIGLLLLANLGQVLYTTNLKSSYESKLQLKDIKISELKYSVANLSDSIDSQNEAITSLELKQAESLAKFNERLAEAELTSQARLNRINKLESELNIPVECNSSIEWLLNKTLEDRGKK